LQILSKLLILQLKFTRGGKLFLLSDILTAQFEASSGPQGPTFSASHQSLPNIHSEIVFNAIILAVPTA
jgi:hypothetical protein